jgi:hypothetical protein
MGGGLLPFRRAGGLGSQVIENFRNPWNSFHLLAHHVNHFDGDLLPWDCRNARHKIIGHKWPDYHGTLAGGVPVHWSSLKVYRDQYDRHLTDPTTAPRVLQNLFTIEMAKLVCL